MSTTPDSSLLKAINQRVQIQTYDLEWPTQFTLERSRLNQCFPNAFLAIEHFGSTAVPGLAAKPVIDMLAGVDSMHVADELLGPLCQVGYDMSAEFNATLQDRRWLMRHKDGKRTHHLHLVIYGQHEWQSRLAFRDALRNDQGLVAQYETLKRRLAKIHEADREAYTAAKSDFIKSYPCPRTRATHVSVPNNGARGPP